MSSWKWYAGAATSALAPLIPAIGDPLSWRATKVVGKFGLGATRLHPVGMFLGAVQVGYLAFTNRDFIARELGYASDRITGRDNPDAWKHTPRDEARARVTHGWFVSSRDRMRRNPALISSAEVARRDFERYT